MTREQFEAMAVRAEELARTRPRVYRLLLVAMAVGGYAYILLILLTAMGLLAALGVAMLRAEQINGVELKLLIGLFVVIGLILRALWVRLPPPAGVPLRREDVPRLFELIDDVRRAVHAPPARVVLLNHEFNASVSQIPRLGFLGWYRNYLAVGLPLLDAVTPEQFRAVLAHEFGHLSGAHGKFGVWIYRMRQTWQQVVTTFAQRRSWLTYLFLPVFRRLVPRFTAFSWVQIRQHEFAADRWAKDVAGAEQAAGALVRIGLANDLLAERFWPGIFRRTHTEAQPPAPFADMAACLQQFDDARTAAFWVRRDLGRQKESYDTHPTLAARLAALRGGAPPGPGAAEDLVAAVLKPGPCAAEFCLGAQRERLTAAVDRSWQQLIARQWEQRHRQVQERQAQLNALDRKAAQAALTVDEAWGRAWLTEDVRGAAAALPLYQAILAANPDDLRTMFAVGRLLLARKDAAGRTLIEAVMAKEEESRANGCHILAQYYYQSGEMDEARRWQVRAEEESGAAGEAADERTSLRLHDTFTPHGLDAATVSRLHDQLTAVTKITRAYLVQKAVKHGPDQPCYVLAVVRRAHFWRYEDATLMALRNKELAGELVKQLSPGFAVRIFVLQKSALLRRVANVPGAEIYRV